MPAARKNDNAARQRTVRFVLADLLNSFTKSLILLNPLIQSSKLTTPSLSSFSISACERCASSSSSSPISVESEHRANVDALPSNN